jgi:DNA-binding NarL/FixJ family response regulator
VTSESSSGTSPIRVLVVDDNEDVRVLVAARLELTGRYAVVGQADDGGRAVEVAAGCAPRVIVLDLSMPGIGGLEAIPLLRVAAPDATIIVMSGHAERSLIEQVMAAGAGGYVEKGLRTDFVKVIDEILAGSPA